MSDAIKNNFIYLSENDDQSTQLMKINKNNLEIDKLLINTSNGVGSPTIINEYFYLDNIKIPKFSPMRINFNINTLIENFVVSDFDYATHNSTKRNYVYYISNIMKKTIFDNNLKMYYKLFDTSFISTVDIFNFETSDINTNNYDLENVINNNLTSKKLTCSVDTFRMIFWFDQDVEIHNLEYSSIIRLKDYDVDGVLYNMLKQIENFDIVNYGKCFLLHHEPTVLTNNYISNGDVEVIGIKRNILINKI